MTTPNNPGWQFLAKQTSTLKVMLRDTLNQPLRTIPESVFINNFLPWLAGEATGNHDEFLRNWISLAGNRLCSIMVVNEFNNPVIEVPPLCDRSRVKMTYKNGNAVEQVIEKTTHQGMLSPNIAGQKLATSLEQRFLVDPETPANNEWLDKWQVVFTKYGKDPSKLIITKAKAEELKKPQQAEVSTNTDDQFDFNNEQQF
jgi:hypothetical protein